MILVWRGLGLLVGVIVAVVLLLTYRISDWAGIRFLSAFAPSFAAIAVYLFNRLVLRPKSEDDIWLDTFFLAPVKWWPAILIGLNGLGFVIFFITQIIVWYIQSQ